MSEVPGSYFKATPQLAERIKALQQQNRNYLAHEYLNRHWTPIFFTQMAEQMAQAKLTFAAHANPLNCIDALNHPKELQAILQGIQNPIFREAVRDMGINQTFRRDIYVRGPRRQPPADQRAALLDPTYALVVDRAACNLTIKTAAGEAVLQPNLYDPILDRMAQSPATGHELLALPAVQAQGGAGRLMQALVVMVGSGYVYPCAEPDAQRAAQDSCNRFNATVMARTTRGGDAAEFSSLASARTGSGVTAPRLPQLYLQAVAAQPQAADSDLAAVVWRQLKAAAQRLMKDGKSLEGDAANLEELVARIAEWRRDSLPLLQQLRIAG